MSILCYKQFWTIRVLYVIFHLVTFFKNLVIDLIIVNLKKKIVLDTSIIIDGHISHKIDNKDIDDNFEIIIPRAAIDELQSQACKQREHGFMGLAELRKIREKSSENNILLRIYGENPI